MTENNVSNNDNSTGKNKTPKQKIFSKLILSTLIVVAALTILIMVNNQLSARTSSSLNNNPVFAGGSCCRTGNSTAGGENQLAISALNYYRDNYEETEGLTARVDDFGCHQEISISRNGIEVRRFGFSNGTFYEITP
ncbi:MAG: hypothetical protein K0B84_03395 [Firmicutes bacterium]|nr:hypothetical protein [Bacillota bacterium]